MATRLSHLCPVRDYVRAHRCRRAVMALPSKIVRRPTTQDYTRNVNSACVPNQPARPWLPPPFSAVSLAAGRHGPSTRNVNSASSPHRPARPRLVRPPQSITWHQVATSHQRRVTRPKFHCPPATRAQTATARHRPHASPAWLPSPSQRGGAGGEDPFPPGLRSPPQGALPLRLCRRSQMAPAVPSAISASATTPSSRPNAVLLAVRLALRAASARHARDALITHVFTAPA